MGDSARRNSTTFLFSIVIFQNQEAEAEMVGHARADDGSGVVVASSVVNHLEEMKIDKECMRIVSGDSTNANTGSLTLSLSL